MSEQEVQEKSRQTFYTIVGIAIAFLSMATPGVWYVSGLVSQSELKAQIKVVRTDLRAHAATQTAFVRLKTRVDLAERLNHERHGEMKQRLKGIDDKLQDIADRLPRRRGYPRRRRRK